MLRLAELGVSVVTVDGFSGMNIRLLIPHWKGQEISVYIEIGYLLAQLGDESFPEDFRSGISCVPSALFNGSLEYDVIYTDANPGHMKVTLALKEEREAETRVRTCEPGMEPRGDQTT